MLRLRMGRLVKNLFAALLLTCCKSSPHVNVQRSQVASLASTPSISANLLRDGDLIFQESTSGQSEMVAALTKSRWTHMGVIFLEPAGPVVLEAASPVRRTSLRTWIARGREKRYVVKRVRDADARLPATAIDRMKRLAASWLGRPYDLRFRWDDHALYCSELAFKLFDRGANLQVGQLQHAADMNLGDPLVRKAIAKRFANIELNPDETVVTPDSMFNDEQLLTVEL
jgi:hypothetical protein